MDLLGTGRGFLTICKAHFGNHCYSVYYTHHITLKNVNIFVGFKSGYLSHGSLLLKKIKTGIKGHNLRCHYERDHEEKYKDSTY
jgi:hypothetical protein